MWGGGAVDDGDRYLAIGHDSLPYITIYNTSDWSKVDDPATLPTGTGRGVAFHGSLLAVAHPITPFVTIYNTSDWSKIADPVVLPTGSANAVAFSPDGSLLAVGHYTSPYITIYNTSDWSKVADPTTLPTNPCFGVAFSPDGSKLAAATSWEPYLHVYNTTDWSEATIPVAPPDESYAVAFSPDGSLLAVAHKSTPYFAVYRTSDWAISTPPTSLPAGIGNGVAFSPDGSLLAIAHTFSPYITTYNVADWSKRANPAILPTSTGRGVAFSPDGILLAVAHTNSPRVTMYRLSNWSKLKNPETLPGSAYSAAFGETLALNDIGTPGGAGFGVGVAPVTPSGFSVLTGTTDSTRTHDNFGNYQYADGSVMCWVPLFYYRIGHADNPTYAAYGVNSVDVLPESAFVNEAAANAAGYALHRVFTDGGAVKRGVMVDKYMCSSNAWGTGTIASSIKNGNPLSAHLDHNPLTGLTACSVNQLYEFINAAHARDGVDGAVNASSIFFPASRFIYSALALLSLAHGQAATAADSCAWYDATGVINFPKGCNNNALADTNDTAVKWESDGYSTCGKTGSAGYGGGAGNEFAKSAHNGQNCGIVDLNGLMWEASLGFSSIVSSVAIAGLSRANPCVVTWTGHGLATGGFAQIDAITQADWTVLNGKIYTVTRIDDNSFSLDGVDTSGIALDYDPVADPGTIKKGTFYAAKTSAAMKDFTSGIAAATDHWGATGLAAMMDQMQPVFETGYPNNGFAQRFGDGAGQVLAEDVSGNDWLQTGLGFPSAAAGISLAGTNLFGTDYYYQYMQDSCFLLSGGSWGYAAYAGVWAAGWSGGRAGTSSSVGVRLACYPV